MFRLAEQPNRGEPLGHQLSSFRYWEHLSLQGHTVLTIGYGIDPEISNPNEERGHIPTTVTEKAS